MAASKRRVNEANDSVVVQIKVERDEKNLFTTETQRHRASREKSRDLLMVFIDFHLPSPCLCVSVVQSLAPMLEVSI